MTNRWEVSKKREDIAFFERARTISEEVHNFLDRLMIRNSFTLRIALGAGVLAAFGIGDGDAFGQVRSKDMMIESTEARLESTSCISPMFSAIVGLWWSRNPGIGSSGSVLRFAAVRVGRITTIADGRLLLRKSKLSLAWSRRYMARIVRRDRMRDYKLRPAGFGGSGITHLTTP